MTDKPFDPDILSTMITGAILARDLDVTRAAGEIGCSPVALQTVIDGCGPCDVDLTAIQRWLEYRRSIADAAE